MNDALPSHRYYKACEGRWRGPLSMRITDWKAFFVSEMSLFDRASLLSLLSMQKLLGACHLDTSVECEPENAVVHTTRVHKLGLTFLQSREVLQLDDDGITVRMQIEMRLFPTALRVQQLDARKVVVDAGGFHVDYWLPWMGIEMHQHGERSVDGQTVVLTQVTECTEGVQVLRRC